MYAEFEMWLKMRERLLDGLEAVRQEHESEIMTEFEHDSAIQNELAEYVDFEEKDGIIADLFYEFSDNWLVQHGYAFFDSVQGVLPIKWRDIPRDQWGEVHDPTMTYAYFPPWRC